MLSTRSGCRQAAESPPGSRAQEKKQLVQSIEERRYSQAIASRALGGDVYRCQSKSDEDGRWEVVGNWRVCGKSTVSSQ